jgi:ABC-type antimicrobial peptide transport system permease subunit
MFFTYIRRELGRRRRQAIVVALGLGIGIGLVVTVTAMSSGVRSAQAQVLRSLYGVGTDATVTTQATPGDDGGARFELDPPDGSQAGDEFTRENVVPEPGLGTMSEDDVAEVAQVDGVDSAVGGLSLTSLRIDGEFRAPDDGDTGGFAGPAAGPTLSPLDVSSISIAGVDVSEPNLGAVTASQLTRGRFFEAGEADENVAVVDRGYAKQEKLSVGSTITLRGTKFEVIGISTAPTGGDPVNVAIPLDRARDLAGLDDDAVNRIYVKATSASQISSMQSGIEEALPKATVTTAADLASQVTGSLASASNLAQDLGRWLSIAALAAAFAVASLLTMSAVGRRVREFGTLKAIGWRSRRVVAQVMGESLVVGLLGGALGVAIGFAGAWLVSSFFPSLEASTGLTGLGGPAFVAGGPGGAGGGLADALGSTVSVPLDATVSLAMVGLAIGLALLGGLVAGTTGGWRAARLRPAEALRRVA